MRVMVIVKASKQSEAGQMPSQQLLADMGKFNQDLMAAGIMMDGGGLHPSFEGRAGEVFRQGSRGHARPVRQHVRTGLGLLDLEGEFARRSD